jgi:Domain of unknown function (DUF3854)
MRDLWRRVNSKQPCRICGKPDWCRISGDGQWAVCRRLDTGDGHRKVDKVGVEYWVYHLHGNQAPTPMPLIPLSRAPAERAPDEVLDLFYRALLQFLSLSAQHRAQLTHRGLQEEDISFRQYRSLPRHGRAALANRLVELFGETICAHIPGLYIHKEIQRRWWSLAGAPGLVIPVRNVSGQIIALTVRSDDPETPSRYSAISSTKYHGPSPGAPIHIPLMTSEATSVIRLTEGVLKADIATTLSGLHTIGLPGVSMWASALPFLGTLPRPVIRLAFDMDASRNLQVAMALRQTARRLRAEGMAVQLEVWDEADGKGIDDLLATGQTPTVLTGAAMIDELNQMIRSATLVDPLQIARRWEGKRQRYIQRLRLPLAAVEVAHGNG